MTPDLIIFGASLVYFLTMMFDHHPRCASFFAGVLLIGSAGTVLKEEDSHAFFELIAAIGIALILIRRVYVSWRT